MLFFRAADILPVTDASATNRGQEIANPSWVREGRIPCLDGLRAVAIAAVLDAHLNGRQNVGHLGVNLFFVISGFLITLLMLREQERTGTVSLPNFYRRRILRIVPALTVFLLFVLALQGAGFLTVLPRYWIAAFTYTMGYVSFGDVPAIYWWNIAHTWSLTVEEHFYLVFPFLFVVVKPVNAFKALVAYLVLVPLLRFAILHFCPTTLDVTTVSITEMGGIGLGCVAAYVAQGAYLPQLNRAMRRYTGALLLIGGMLIIVETVLGSEKLQSIAQFVIPVEKIIGDPLAALGFALLLLWAVHLSSKTVMYRILNRRAFVYVGTLSYSIYLWQQLFTRFGVFAHRPGLWGSVGVTLLLIGACALASYYGVEVPFLRLKARGAKVAKPLQVL